MPKLHREKSKKGKVLTNSVNKTVSKGMYPKNGKSTNFEIPDWMTERAIQEYQEKLLKERISHD